MTPKFHTTRKRLTSYALGCGYIESKTINSVKIQLYKEHSVFHVRAFFLDGETSTRLAWVSVPTLKSAHRIMAQMVRTVRIGKPTLESQCHRFINVNLTS